MSDLIDRQAAIDALGDEPEVWSGKDEYEQGLNNQWHHDVNALKALPFVQPERKTGNWTRISMDKYTQHAQAWYRCSECQGEFIGKWNYCPNCGADMRGENNE